MPGPSYLGSVQPSASPGARGWRTVDMSGTHAPPVGWDGTAITRNPEKLLSLSLDQ